MKRCLTVELPGRAYDIEIRRGLLDETGPRCAALLPRAQRLFIVTDANVAALYGQRVVDSVKRAGFQTELMVLAHGESTKCSRELLGLWDEMMAFGLTRTDAVVALGGGVIGDLAGFAAATILRGVDLVQIPTTLLAQVDSSIGGKVAIDLPAGKNLAGAFWQPKVVLMDPDCLSSLSDQIFSDGMAEVIKYGCILDEAFFRLLKDCGGRAGVMERIEEVLYTCCDLKRQVVLQDERDTGRRMLLNFGHTIGHAFELAGHYETWTHGQAVAAGMVRASWLGAELGITPPSAAEEIQEILRCYDLPTELPCPWETMVEAVGLDKKRAGSQITMVLLEKLGRAVLHPMEKEQLLDRLEAVYGRSVL